MNIINYIYLNNSVNYPIYLFMLIHYYLVISSHNMKHYYVIVTNINISYIIQKNYTKRRNKRVNLIIMIIQFSKEIIN